MRFALIIALCWIAAPAAAWKFTAQPVCTIWHTDPDGEMVVTYDPSRPEPYAISVELPDAVWRNTSNYRILFDGPNRFAIATNRHRLSDDEAAVIASDRGFDNVLRGLETNWIATARLGETSVTIPLAGAAEAVQKFRDCTVTGLS